MKLKQDWAAPGTGAFQVSCRLLELVVVRCKGIISERKRVCIEEQIGSERYVGPACALAPGPYPHPWGGGCPHHQLGAAGVMWII